MSVTPTSLGAYSANDILTAKLREWLAHNPIEQARLGNRALDHLEQTSEFFKPSANEYHVPVSFIEDAKGGFYDGNDPASAVVSQDVTIAKYGNTYLYEPARLLRTEKRENSGRAIFDVMKHRLKQSRIRAHNKFASAIMQEAKVTKGPETIPLAIPDDPTAAVSFGGIDPSVNTGWQNQSVNMNGAFTSNINDLDTISEDVTKYGLSDWDFMIAPQNIYLLFKTVASNDRRINQSASAPGTSRSAALGWKGVTFEDKPVISDRHCPAGTIYVVNSEAMKLCVDPEENYVTEGPVDLRPGSHAWAWYVYLAAQLVVLERSALGVVYNITAS